MTSALAPAASTATPVSYEAALAELESLVAAMEGGQMPLAGLLEGYRRGATLLQFCRQQLQAVDEQVQVVENGELRSWQP